MTCPRPAGIASLPGASHAACQRGGTSRRAAPDEARNLPSRCEGGGWHARAFFPDAARQNRRALIGQGSGSPDSRPHRSISCACAAKPFSMLDSHRQFRCKCNSFALSGEGRMAITVLPITARGGCLGRFAVAERAALPSCARLARRLAARSDPQACPPVSARGEPAHV